MPRVEIRDANGQTYHISTLNLEMLGQWLGEWVPRLSVNDASYPPLELTVWPLWDSENKPDIPGASFTVLANKDGYEAMVATLSKAFLGVEAQAARGRRRFLKTTPATPWPGT